ncbi:hypothetical protein J437_LFUL000857 [Ladona fulva]|uniref:Uncharacterized protein n=1 Tax=Ladona fulva TaxID=123851 RepID=A0A8K0NWB7_LADFU|nr:hypothetical protein J437_LFUL000857 [Ladona fulva]
MMKDVEALGYGLGFTTDKQNFHNVSLGQGQEVVAETAMDIAALSGHWVVLQAFSVVFQKAIEKADAAENVKIRVQNLIDCITYSVYMYTTRGLFECDKLIFASQMAFQILLMNEEIAPQELDFLLRFPITPHVTSPVDFLSNTSWGGIRSLSCRDEFRNLDRDIESSWKRWKKLVESECPEKEKFPQEWKNKSALQRLCMMRALRPDRMTYAIASFIEEKLGPRYVEGRTMEFSKSFEETSPSTPIFFILSPGVNPLKVDGELQLAPGFIAPPNTDFAGYHVYIDEAMPPESPYLYGLHPNAEIGFLTTTSDNLFRTVFEMQPRDAGTSGGQTVTREDKVKQILDEILEKLPEEFNMTEIMGKVEERTPYVIVAFQECERMNYLTGEIKRSLKELDLGLKGILESSIKITNEPPTGMSANVHKALDNFSQETLEMCGKEAEFKAILFSLCYFHAVVAERRKFGPQGWNRIYPFNVVLNIRKRINLSLHLTGDLTISAHVLFNYLEANQKVPWEDLRYLFGEIMYGGHITDDWDRRLCITYLEELMQPELVCHMTKYLSAPREGAYVHGLFMEGARWDIQAGLIMESRLKELFPPMPVINIRAITQDKQDSRNMYECPVYKTRTRGPTYVWTFHLKTKDKPAKWTLAGVALLLQGELTITSDMENLENALFLDQVPPIWTHRAFPSLLGLGSWFAHLLLRIRELETWSSDFVLPASVWLAGFFNPQSFLTAIMQSTARRNELPLDKMCLQCDVTKKQKEDFSSAPREGAYVHGLFMEGARWDIQAGLIMESRLKELFPPMPVINIRAITQDKQDSRNMYECPVYKTRTRGPTYVWTFHLKTKDKPAKWTLAGVALLLQV